MKTRRLSLILGLAILLVFVFAAFAPSIFTGYERKEVFDAWLKNSNEHILGTNALGYDIYTELVYGAGSTLFVGLVSAIVSLLLALILGLLSSKKGVLGAISAGIINIFSSIPKLVCLIVLSCFVGSDKITIVLLIAIFSFAPSARLISSKVKALNESLFIENLKVEGFSNTHIAIYHMLPNLFDILLSRFLMAVNSCIMMESTLAFLGIGDTYYPSWGTMVNLAYKNGAMLRGAYSYILMPGHMIAILSLSYNLIANYIESKRNMI